MYRLFCTFILMMFFLPRGISQFANFQNASPASAEVASFAKSIDIPMNYSSGIPQIGIPIYTIKDGPLEVPISLSYNASGIRVEENPTWTGLGWNLNTGGMVTRTVRGLPDDTQYGYIHSIGNSKIGYLGSLSVDDPEWDNVSLQLLPIFHIDIEPDIFNFSVMGYSGEFYWNQDSNKFILTPYQNIKIECPGGNNPIGQIILTLPNGVKCYFGGQSNNVESLFSSETTYYEYVANLSYDTPISDPSSGPYGTAWHIDKLVAPTGEEIHYNYSTLRELIIEYGRAGETYSFGDAQSVPHVPPSLVATFFKRQYQKPSLQSISWRNGQINFNRSITPRLDVMDSSKSLDNIEIKDKNGIEIKSFYFNYDYWTSLDSTTLWGIVLPFEEVARKRLYLQSITEHLNGDSLPPYQFSYNELLLPNRLSTSQDYWGYYNAKNVGGRLLMPRIPAIPGNGLPGYNLGLPFGYMNNLNHADRRIDTVYAQAGILTKITYPTGGSTEYFYESNTSLRIYFNDRLHSNNGISLGIEAPDMVDRAYTFFPLIPANPPYPLNYSDTFRISRPATQVNIIPNLPSPCSENASTSCRYEIRIKNLEDTTISIIIKTTPPLYSELPDGLYKIEAIITDYDSYIQPFFSVNLSWGEHPDPYNFKVGGLRVNKIVSRDGLGGTISRSFSYVADSSASTGILAGFPVHILQKNDASGQLIGIDKIVSNSTIPLTTDGQIVRYWLVNEYLDSAKSSMKTRYHFSSDYQAIFGNYENVPSQKFSWRNNLLLQKEVFEKTTNEYRIISDEQHFYKPFNTLVRLAGFSSGRTRPYNLQTEWYLADSSISHYYTYPNNTQQVLISGSKNLYNDSFMLFKTQEFNSQNKIIENKIWYPYDYNNISGYNLSSLIDQHILALPIKQERSVNGKIVSGNIVKYNNYGEQTEIYSYEGAPLADTVGHNRNTILEGGYQLKGTVEYKDHQPEQIIKNPSTYIYYIWDNDASHLIAELNNCIKGMAAYTSFENNADGNWSISSSSRDADAITGRLSYNLSNGTVSKSGLTLNNKYIISYWSKSGIKTINGGTPEISAITGKTVNGWTYYEHLIKASGSTLSINGSGLIDELRLYPQGSQMISYNYRDLVGLTDKADANNNILYYEYDNFNRLSLIRDQNRNVVKKFCYNYAGQPESCAPAPPLIYYNLDQYQSFARNNCPSGQTASSVIYSVNAGTYQSLISVADANNKALADIALNGQDYANLHGSCTLPCTNCTSPNRHCSEGVCLRGIGVYTTLGYNEALAKYECTLHYEFSDGYWSPSEYFLSDTPCGL